MQSHYWQPEVECAPLSELVSLMEAKLAATDVFVRAARSPFYRERWRQSGVIPESIRSYADLRRIPYATAANLRAVQQPALFGEPGACSMDDFVCGEERPRFWISTSGSTGVPKWIPVSAADQTMLRDIGARIVYFSHDIWTMDDVIFGVSAPAPFLSDMENWSGLLEELRGDGLPKNLPVEGITFSFESGVEGVAMALKRKVTAFLAFPSLVMRIASGISEGAPQTAEQQLRRKFTLVNLLAYLVTRVRRIRARDLMRVHTGIFGGEPLDPYRTALLEEWGMKHSINLYMFSEHRVPTLECLAHDGMHMWIDASLPEVISQADLDRERDEPGYVPPARPLWDAAAGDVGELVITHFGKAFPLVRWRTGDLIRVISTAPCRCGRTHPRIQVLQRIDDTVNLGIIRFSIFALQERLESVDKPARVANWQLRVGRQGYKPILTVLVRPDRPAAEGEFAGAVRAAIDQLETLRLGWQNGLVCEPAVKIVPDLGDRLSTSGKLRPLVYETAEYYQAPEDKS